MESGLHKKIRERESLCLWFRNSRIVFEATREINRIKNSENSSEIKYKFEMENREEGKNKKWYSWRLWKLKREQKNKLKNKKAPPTKKGLPKNENE